jgi:hypothetical protein
MDRVAAGTADVCEHAEKKKCSKEKKQKKLRRHKMIKPYLCWRALDADVE